jgi:hypothetical protein
MLQPAQKFTTEKEMIDSMSSSEHVDFTVLPGSYGVDASRQRQTDQMVPVIWLPGTGAVAPPASACFGTSLLAPFEEEAHKAAQEEEWRTWKVKLERARGTDGATGMTPKAIEVGHKQVKQGGRFAKRTRRSSACVRVDTPLPLANMRRTC